MCTRCTRTDASDTVHKLSRSSSRLAVSWAHCSSVKTSAQGASQPRKTGTHCKTSTEDGRRQTVLPGGTTKRFVVFFSHRGLRGTATAPQGGVRFFFPISDGRVANRFLFLTSLPKMHTEVTARGFLQDKIVFPSEEAQAIAGFLSRLWQREEWQGVAQDMAPLFTLFNITERLSKKMWEDPQWNSSIKKQVVIADNAIRGLHDFLGRGSSQLKKQAWPLATRYAVYHVAAKLQIALECLYGHYRLAETAEKGTPVPTPVLHFVAAEVDLR